MNIRGSDFRPLYDFVTKILTIVFVVVLLPYVGWTLSKITSHDTKLEVIESNRFTEHDGAELALTFTEAIGELREVVAEMKAENDAVSDRLDRLGG